MADLSKIKIGNEVYNLKDAEIRAIVAGFNNDIVNGQLGLVTEENKLVYSQNIKSYVDAEVAKVKQFSYEVVSTLPEPSADVMFIIYLVPKTEGTGYLEHLCIDKGAETSPRYVFEEIGDTDVDLSGYVTNVSYANGTLSQTKGDGTTATVHEFGNLADADTARGSTTLATADSAAFTNGAVTASATYTPAGNINVTLKDAATATAAVLTKASYTPEGNVDINGTASIVKVLDENGSVTAGTAATFSEGAFTPNTPTVIDTSKFDGGSKTADTFTQGTLPSLGNATKSAFATAGVTASVGTGTDAETLIFTVASTADAVTEQGSFSAGSLPTFSEGAFTPASLAAGFYTEGTAASKDSDSFNGGTPTAVTLPTFKDAEVLTDATATFTGTAKADALVTGVTYVKQEVDAHTFAGTEATINSTGTATGDVNLTKTDKTITITVAPTQEQNS